MHSVFNIFILFVDTILNFAVPLYVWWSFGDYLAEGVGLASYLAFALSGVAAFLAWVFYHGISLALLGDIIAKED